MFFRSQNNTSGKRRRHLDSTKSRERPQVELLEDRLVPTTWTPIASVAQINGPGNYVLTADDSTYHGTYFLLEYSNVTLDGGGHTLDTTNLEMAGTSNVIENCTITGGVSLTDNCTLDHDSMTNLGVYGSNVTVSNNRIGDSTIVNDDRAVAIGQLSNDRFINNTVWGCTETCIEGSGSWNNFSFIGNEFENAGFSAIGGWWTWPMNGLGFQFTNCTFQDNHAGAHVENLYTFLSQGSIVGANDDYLAASLWGSAGNTFSGDTYGVIAPAITSQPTSQTVNAGQPVSFTVAASGSTPLTYQWQKLVSGTWTNISGATSATFALGSAQASDAGQYQVVVSNSAGSVTSSTVSLTVNMPVNTIDDASFETPNVGTGTFSAFQYAPSGTSWTFIGGAGVAGNGSGFTSGNPNAPDGTQVGFLQTTGSFSQSVNFSAGTYQISFLAAQRGNWQASSQTFAVMVDGTVVGSFTPAGTNYAALATNSFTVTAGMHTITFAGLDPNGGDNTAFIDAVQVNVAQVSAPALTNAGFETPNLGTGDGTWSATNYQYNPTGAAWDFSGSSGITGNGSGFTFGNAAAPEGTQVAFLQGTGSFSQSVNFAQGGAFTIAFQAAQRGNWQASAQTFEVLVDGNVVGTFTPGGTSYAAFGTNPFTVGVGSHTIAFVGLNPNGGDNTAFIDAVQVNAVTAIANAGFEAPAVGNGAFAYNPTDTAWTFTGGAGVSGNGSGFTAGNPDAPDGTQVAFLQGSGSLTQTLNLAAGTYTISFQAAQRQNYQASSQTFQVLIDGTVVGTFTPSDTAYASFTTDSFTLAAGSHTLTFVGVNPNGGDNTAFIDAVSLDALATAGTRWIVRGA
jgi:hypothetical protein